jgi:nucleotide-binding universal stress UspA family protein
MSQVKARKFCADRGVERILCARQAGQKPLSAFLRRGPVVAILWTMTNPARRIVVATDFSEGSDEALDQAIDLGRTTGATLQLVHVLEVGVEQFPYGPLFHSEGTGGIVAYVDRELSRRADLVKAAGLPCETRMLEGATSEEIVREARDGAADLIVVGTHGRRGLAHMMLGSVAERVVRHASCPVLTVPFSRKAA